MTAKGAMEFSFSLEAAEQAQVAALVARRVPNARVWRWVSPILLAIPLVIGFGLGWPPAILWPYLAVLGLTAAGSLLLPLLRRRQAARALAESPQFRDLTYRFDAGGMHVATSVSSIALVWAAVTEATETADMFLVFGGRGLAYYVPKRVVGEQMAALRELLTAQLGSRAVGVWSDESGSRQGAT